MAYPSIISALATPQPTDRLNNPSHSTLHQNENSAIVEVQTFVGTLSSSQGTLSYDIRSSDSNGGGHIQTANKGGTGQTSYSKGDLLAAQSSSVLVKVAIGSDGQVLQSDSGQSSGVKWSTVIANKIAIVSSTTGTANASLLTLYASSVLGSTLGVNNAVRFTVPFSTLALVSGQSAVISVSYGNNGLLSMNLFGSGFPKISGPGRLEGMLFANNATNSQKAYATIYAGNNNMTSSFLGSGAYGTSSVESTANQLLTIQAQGGGAGFGSVVGEALIIEKIV